MNDTDHCVAGGDTIAFRAHDGVIRAIDDASAQEGRTRSDYVRRAIVQYLRAEGWLGPTDPASKYEARHRNL